MTTHPLFGSALALALCTAASAEITLSPAFTDHAVLQRDVPVRIFGGARPGEKVAVALRGPKGDVLRVATAVGGSDGRFAATLDPLKGSSEPLTLEVTGDSTVTVRDIVVGEVWIAGGQSNMEWPVAATGPQLAEALAVADDPGIRMLKAPHATASAPAQRMDVQWTVASRDSVPQMSAVGFWFARAVRARTGVPVGILSINWGGSRAEPWTDLATLEANPAYAPRIDAMRAEAQQWRSGGEEGRARAFEAKVQAFSSAASAWWAAANADEPGAASRWADPSVPADGSAWTASALPSAWSADPQLRDFDGIVWYRRAVDVPASWAGKECVVELGPIDDADMLYVDGSPVASTVGDWTTPRRYVIPGDRVRAGAMTLAIEVLDMHGEGGLVGAPAAMRMSCPSAGGGPIGLAGQWMRRRGGEAKRLPQMPSRPAMDAEPGTRFGDPAAMFNGMIAPVAGLQVRGAIWYQGESNAGSDRDVAEYRALLPLVVRSWRGAFESPGMPFGVVSLAAFRPFVPGKPIHGLWPGLRDAQLDAERAVPGVGTVTTTDVGDADDIHPRDKRTVGERLARWAAATSYGAGDLAWRGPRVTSARREGDGILIEFDVEGGALAARDGKALGGFAVAGSDGVHAQAEASIVSPRAVLVRSAAVASPVEVRYGWQDNPQSANLADGASGLPAHPFRAAVSGGG